MTVQEIVNSYKIAHSNMSCDEIAEDLQQIAGKGYVLYFRRKDKKEMQILEQHGEALEPTPYYYHAVFVDGTKVYDLRRSKTPVSLTKYKEEVKKLNNADIEYSKRLFKDLF